VSPPLICVLFVVQRSCLVERIHHRAQGTTYEWEGYSFNVYPSSRSVPSPVDLSLSPVASRSVPALCICIQSSKSSPRWWTISYSQGPKDSLDYRVFFKQGGACVAGACFFQDTLAMHALGNLYPSLSTHTQPRPSPLGTRSLCMPETETCTTSARSPKRPPPRWRWPRCVGGGGEARAKKR